MKIRLKDTTNNKYTTKQTHNKNKHTTKENTEKQKQKYN